MEYNRENNEEQNSPKSKYIEESFIKNQIFNCDINYINYNNFSHLGTTNLPTDFNNFTDLDYLDPDIIITLNNKKTKFQYCKNEDKKSFLDNTFDNVKVNLIEEIKHRNNFDDIIHPEKQRKYDNIKEIDNSYSQTFHNIPLEIYKRNHLKGDKISIHKTNFLKKKVKKGKYFFKLLY